MAGTTQDPKVRGEIYQLPVADIRPDPDQPRLEVDDELAASLKAQGQLRPIEVRPDPSGAEGWMIVDGERRWRAAKKAGLRTIDATVTFDVEGISVAQRLIRQVTHNTGKPLTPVEEALVFRRIITDRQQTDKKFGVVQLAKELGLAKSTVADRLAITEIPKFWLPLIIKGPLQASHVPALHRWRLVPEKFQARALEQLDNDYQYTRTTENPKKGDRVPVDTFEYLINQHMEKFIKPVSDVPGYEGPTMQYDGKKCAADPAKWQPIWRKRQGEKRAKANASRASGKVPAVDAQQARYRKQQEEQEQARKAYIAAQPRILAAIAEKLNSFPAGSNSYLADLVLGSVKSHQSKNALVAGVARGTTLEQTLRHFAAHVIHHSTYEYRAPRDLPPILAKLGLNYDALVKVEKPKSNEDKQRDLTPAEKKLAHGLHGKKAGAKAHPGSASHVDGNEPSREKAGQ